MRSPGSPSPPQGASASLAGVFPSALTSEGVDGVLYKGARSLSHHRQVFQRKPPHLDFAGEYHASGKKPTERSYHAARSTIDALTKQHRQQQITQEEAFDRDANAAKFTANFVETQLGTCGVPTLNGVGVRMARQRRKMEASESSLKQQQHGKASTTSERVCAAIRRAYGSHTLDLKALELIHIPREVDTTMLMQLARTIRCVNVSRNALRELPPKFCAAFPEVEELLLKENALDQLPATLADLRYVKILDVECNQLAMLPAHLPVSLEALVASHNRLTEIANLHALTRLVTLELARNHLEVLPLGFMALTKLKMLTLSGNRLVTLALLPKLVVNSSASCPQQEDYNSGDEGDASQWRVEVDPLTKDTIYFHNATKRVTRTKPKCFQIHIPKLALGGQKSNITQEQQQQTQDQQRRGQRTYKGGGDWIIHVGDGSNAADVLCFENKRAMKIVTKSIPAELDTIGDLRLLQTLSIAGNQLMALPPSVGKLVHLQRLDAEHNQLLALPDTLQDLQALQVLKLGMNALSSLPQSFMSLPNLTEYASLFVLGSNASHSQLCVLLVCSLDLKLNRFQFLPSNFGALTRLHMLDLSANRLETLPQSFLQLTRLTAFKLQNNAPELMRQMRITSESIAAGSIAQVMWHLKHQVECERRGAMPPVAESVIVGVGNEMWSTNLHVHKDFVHAVAVAEQTHVLDFHWKSLTLAQFPPKFFTALTHLQELRLSGNNLDTLPSAFLASFGALRLLQLRKNKTRELAEDVFACDGAASSSLLELDLEYNLLETLPPSIASLRKLQILRMSNNRLTTFPDSIGALSEALTQVHAAHNRLRAAPQCFSALHALQSLDMLYNQLQTLEALEFASLRSLTSLLVNVNELQALPTALGDASQLQELWIAGNQLVETQFVAAQKHRAQVLDEFLQLCRLIQTKKWVDKVDFRYDGDRPWGRHGELVAVYMVNPAVVFEDQPTLPSVLSVVRTRVRHGFDKEAFTCTRRDVQDAIENFVGVYGPIGIAHDNVPFKCGCEELLRYNKMHSPCWKPGWTLVQVVYTQEEADRRVADETKIADAVQALRPQIETFLRTVKGEKRQIAPGAARTEEKTHQDKAKWKARKRALDNRVKRENALRKKDPAAADAELAALSVGDVQARQNEEDTVKTLEERVRTWTTEYEHGKAQLGHGYAAFMNEVVTKLLTSVGAEVTTHLIQQQREKAIAFEWRRPWDGRNGSEFEKYKLLVRRKILENGTMEQEETPQADGDGDAGGESDNSEISDVSFEGYADLINMMAAGGQPPTDGNDDDVDDDEDSARGEDRAAMLANLVVSDDDTNLGENDNDSEDSDL